MGAVGIVKLHLKAKWSNALFASFAQTNGAAATFMTRLLLYYGNKPAQKPLT
jgi:hypothetical protein